MIEGWMGRNIKANTLTWENNWHFETPPLFSPWNDVFRTLITAEVPCSDENWPPKTWVELLTVLRCDVNLLQPIKSTTRIRMGGKFWQSYLRRHFSRKPVVSRNVGCFVKLRTRLLLPNPIHICWCISQLRLKVYEQPRLLLETVAKGEKQARCLLRGRQFSRAFEYRLSSSNILKCFQ